MAKRNNPKKEENETPEQEEQNITGIDWSVAPHKQAEQEIRDAELRLNLYSGAHKQSREWMQACKQEAFRRLDKFIDLEAGTPDKEREYWKQVKQMVAIQ